MPLGPVGASLLVLGAGLVSAPVAANTFRLLLRYVAGWTFDAPWQTAFLTLATVWVQNGVWLLLASVVLKEWRRDPVMSALADVPPAGWLRWRAAVGDVAAGAGWGLLLLVVNGLSARVSIAFWQKVLPPEQFAARFEQERGVLVALFAAEQPPWVLAALVVTVAVVAPLGEEVVFRGLLHRALRIPLGRQAAMVSSALFAGIHLYLIHFLPVFVLGILLARLYERRGSLLAPVVAHGVVNGLVALVQLALRSVQAV